MILSAFIDFLKSNWLILLATLIVLILLIIVIIILVKQNKDNDNDNVESTTGDTELNEQVSENNVVVDKEEKNTEEKETVSKDSVSKPKTKKTKKAEASEKKEEVETTSEVKEEKKEKTKTKKVATEEKKEVKEDISEKETTFERYRVTYDKEKADWVVKKDGGMRATKRFRTKQEALNYVEGLCDRKGASLSVHKKNGKFQKQ